MPRFEIYLDPRLKPILEKQLKNPEIIKLLIRHQLKEDASGVAKLAVYKFLEDSGFLSVTDTESDRPNT